MFYSKTKPRETISQSVGRKEKNTYFIKVDELGHKSVHQQGVTNFYNKIQEHAEDCKIENIIKRATLGDMTALNRNNAQYFDRTGMPTSLAEAQQAIINLENVFSTLSIDIRREYNFSPEQFIADFGSVKWNKLMGIEPAPAPVEPTPAPTEKEV